MSRVLTVRPFAPADQTAAQALILAGLAERWGRLDPTRNPDLRDIATSYADGHFLVVVADATLVATGALLPEADGVVRVVRMSVRRDLRGQGIGRCILDALLTHARSRGCHTAVLETTSTWRDAVRFYVRYGFRITHEAEGETHMVLALGDASAAMNAPT